MLMSGGSTSPASGKWNRCDGENVTSTLHVRLANDVGAPKQARAAVGAWLAEAHLDNPATLLTVELVTSELVTNALVHVHAAPGAGGRAQR